jgi:hypothetical protein
VQSFQSRFDRLFAGPGSRVVNVSNSAQLVEVTAPDFAARP